ARGRRISAGGRASLFPGLGQPDPRRHHRALRGSSGSAGGHPGGFRPVARDHIHHGPRRTPARLMHLWRQADGVAGGCGPCKAAYRPLFAGRHQAGRYGFVDFEETDTTKSGWRLAALALFATLAHAEGYLSPTEERVRPSLGVVHYSNQTNFELDSSAGGLGTPVNAESQFGLD